MVGRELHGVVMCKYSSPTKNLCMCRNFRHFGSKNVHLLIFIGCLNCDMTDLIFGGHEDLGLWD